MPAKTDPINTSNPAGSSDPKQGDDYIRTLARAVLELLNVDHYIGVANPWGSESSGDETGEHAKVTLHAPISDPSNVANKGHLYIKDVNSKAELHFQDEDGDAIQLTSGGEVLFGSLSSIAKNTYLKAIDNAGTGTIDLIKGNASDKPVIKAGAELSTSGDPTAAAGIACKEYVDEQIAANATPATQLCKAWVTHNSSGVKQGTGYNIATVVRNGTGDYTVTFDTAFADANYAVNINSHTVTSEGTFVSIKTKAADSVRYTVTNRAGSNYDFACDLTAFGTQ